MTTTSTTSTRRREKDRERKRKRRRELLSDRVAEEIDALAEMLQPVTMVTGTFEGDVPPYAMWRGMFHSVAGALRRSGFATWVMAVPHTGGRGDIHMLMDMPEPIRIRLRDIGGYDAHAARFNRSTFVSPQTARSLQSVYVQAAFGKVVDTRVTPIDSGASDYLLDRGKFKGKASWSGQIWRSGVRTNVSNHTYIDPTGFPD